MFATNESVLARLRVEQRNRVLPPNNTTQISKTSAFCFNVTSRTWDISLHFHLLVKSGVTTGMRGGSGGARRTDSLEPANQNADREKKKKKKKKKKSFYRFVFARLNAAVVPGWNLSKIVAQMTGNSDCRLQLQGDDGRECWSYRHPRMGLNAIFVSALLVVYGLVTQHWSGSSTKQGDRHDFLVAGLQRGIACSCVEHAG
jgi:hypothetical protein